MPTFEVLQQVKNGDILVAGLKELELDRYEVLIFIASELLVLKGLAETSSDKEVVQDLGRISALLVETAKAQARSVACASHPRPSAPTRNSGRVAA
ncbi:MAG: hypothetical protein ACKVP5_13735 [Aestuariivirga sp.]